MKQDSSRGNIFLKETSSLSVLSIFDRKHFFQSQKVVNRKQYYQPETVFLTVNYVEPETLFSTGKIVLAVIR